MSALSEMEPRHANDFLMGTSPRPVAKINPSPNKDGM
jgi:hypothetical protein